MRKGLLKVDWNNIEKYSDEEITYFLFLEGKNIDTLYKIRNISKEEVQNHIIHGKIKYSFFVKSQDEKELLKNIGKAGKLDKLSLLQSLEENIKKNLLNYIKNNYADMPPKDKETAVWIVGELKAINCKDILLKGSVHKFINIRRMAISAMGKIANKDFEVPLMRALDDDNPQVVLYAIKALEKIESKKAIDKIKILEEKWDKNYIKNACENYIESLKEEDSNLKR
ncbi:PBS lyase [Clostridium tetani]|uniref:HEAT repeat domain-containing protein n=1 Tax=Clostridium tetani TaxID=1513 RepID=A0A4Q0VES5_CLOTA|nr:HEAT repeat domain-containing protein [Clostridium tetani]RXI49051.1 HEAT repeat domain-containing protein [Clostridium tetani]RXM77104.1 HEAT repeat domain-containing protein [Clostridium tetani]RYU99348.1 HEAT repeat domain-containing protein [Clostridium tetani]BDR67964.1 PBS lyase [Clostridium tetani]BDR73443.1 PBS lyase [Clostridium tetani]